MALGGAATYANVPEVGTEMNSNSSNSSNNSNSKTTSNNKDQEKEDLDREDPAYEVADNGIPTYAVPRKGKKVNYRYFM